MKLILFVCLMIVAFGDRLGAPQTSESEAFFFGPDFQEGQPFQHRELMKTKFRLKLYWERGYYWQENTKEEKCKCPEMLSMYCRSEE